MVRIYSFDWEIYNRRVMPAFAHWLIDENETAIYQLYAQTRCAHQEQMLPPAMQQLRTWARAQTFIRQLPRGPYSYREYQKLSSAEQFTALSDTYIHRHPPQLHQNAEAVRAIWGAVIEEYCVPWFPASIEEYPTELQDIVPQGQETDQEELAALLHSAGLNELAQEVREQRHRPGTSDTGDAEGPATDEAAEPWLAQEEDAPTEPPGVMIGRHPTILQLRGWLANISIRAMALFELLACGRRRMPFGYRTNEPFESYIGYLTPDEVWHLALCLRNIQPPNASEAEQQYRHFHLQQTTRTETFRILDEIPPMYAEAFMKAVRTSAPQGLGLICRVE